MSWREGAKKRVAHEAVRHVEEGHVIGLGSGSTVAYVIEAIGRRIRQEGLKVMGIPTSHQTFLLAVEHGIPCTTLDEHHELDLAIDGADQVNKELNLIKGMGGALTREKIVASLTEKFVIVIDETKIVEKIGTNHPLPIEILPFALPLVTSKMRELKGIPTLRKATRKVGPVITDNGNFILDVDLGPIDEPKKLDSELKAIPGVVETGLFIDMADTIYIGTQTTIRVLKRAINR